MASYIEDGKFNGVTNWTQPFERTDEFPLDRSSMFDSLDDALAYIKGDGSDKRKLGATSYIGQIISVYENGKVDVYKIVEVPGGSKGLEKVGNGLGSITATNYSAAEELATSDNVGQVVYVLESETRQEPVEGPDPKKEVTYAAGPYIVTGAKTLSKLGTTSASGGDVAADVEILKGQVSTLEETTTNLSTNKIDTITVPSGTGAETKTLTGSAVEITYDSELNATSVNALLNKAINAAYNELKGMISNVPKFKAIVVDALPKSEIDLQAVYFVLKSEAEQETGNIYDEYIYVYDSLDPETAAPVGGKWEKLGTQKLDLTGYAKKEETRLTDADQTEVLLNTLFTKAWKDSVDKAIDTIASNTAAIEQEVSDRAAADEALSGRIKSLEDTNIVADFAGVKTKAEAADILSKSNKSEIDALTSSLAGTEAKADRADKAAVVNASSIEALTNTVNAFDTTYVKNTDTIANKDIDSIVAGTYEPEVKS